MTTLKASEQGLAKIRQARREKGWTIEDPRWLVQASQELEPNRTWTEDGPYADNISLPTWRRFLAGRERIRANAFKSYCQVLGLNWEEIVDRGSNEGTQLPNEVANNRAGEQLENDSSIDDLVQQVRQHCYDKILLLHGKMQLLDISQPIDLEHIYVDVNILEQVTSQQWLEISDLLRGFNPAADNFDRFGLGRVRQERVPGLEAVKRYSRLMVLGKPGSGKTTFLQHVAIECNQGRFQADKVPIFIRLRDFARYAKNHVFIRLKDFAKYDRNQDNFRLFDYISQEFRLCGISDEDFIEAVLNEGRALILLDGLDEVPVEHEADVVAQIEVFSHVFFKNPLIITCRIAASRYRFPSFTDVEVADFNYEQIQSFAKKWFVAVARGSQEEGLAKARQFTEKLNSPENQQIKELAVTPILLHLTCLVFQSRADFPSNRARLYEQGLEILLKRWDETRGIQRDEVYRALTLPRKKQLLSQIGAITFERVDYFFEKNRVQQLIADYLRSLPGASTDPDELQMDSEAVLKAIEAQHGLLVERARGIYSFSHLTFQEYFTAKQISASFELQALKQLASYITEKRWREVFLLTAEMLPNADCLLQLMKQQIDALVAADEKLQQFLLWVNQKSLSVDVSCKPATVRAFYFGVPVARELLITSAFDNYKNRDLSHALEREKDRTSKFYDNFEYDNFDFLIDQLLIYVCYYASNCDIDNLWKSLLLVLKIAPNIELKQSLRELKKQLPNPQLVNKNNQELQANTQAWTEQLRKVMIQHRNIGHDWCFSLKQKKLLRQYYEANKLLIDCLNSSCNVTPAVRAEIEETLLLPISEIEKISNCQDR